MFYVLVFSLLAVVLVVAVIVQRSRRRRNLEYEEDGDRPATNGGQAATGGADGTGRPGEHPHSVTTDAARRKRKAQRAQSRHDRRKRH